MLILLLGIKLRLFTIYYPKIDKKPKNTNQNLELY